MHATNNADRGTLHLLGGDQPITAMSGADKHMIGMVQKDGVKV